MSLSVLMTDTIFPDTSLEKDVFKQEGIDFKLSPASDAGTLIELGKNADALLVVYAEVNAQVIERLERCKVIVKAGIGYNNIDVDAATKKGIIVANVPDYCQGEVADHTFSMLLALARKTCSLSNQVKKGTWDANQGKDVPRIKGKTLGLLGCGAIGQQVAARAEPFGLNVIGFDPYSSPERLEKYKIENITNFDVFLSKVDFLSLHLPLAESTKNIISKETLSKMKETAFIINTSRGGLIDENDLYSAILEGKLAGAALDVLEKEPPSEAPKLSQLDNVIITPHTAFLSRDSVADLRKKASMEIARALTSGFPNNPVNKTNNKT
ncbi:C-terminal binding protein [Vreelandella sp. V005]|uniref:C-terminal binding protein n=1 Tax=Vreelandella sp. V005 TaxID=3459608 RepID=UPI00404447F0